MDDRALWTRAVAREAEKWGFSWSYWEFCSEFGAYDPRSAAVAATAPQCPFRQRLTHRASRSESDRRMTAKSDTEWPALLRRPQST